MREPTFISSTFDLRRSHSWPFVCARTCILPAYVPWTANELVTWTPRDSSALCSRAMPRTRTSVMTKRRDGHSRSAMVLLRLSSPTFTAEPSFGLTLHLAILDTGSSWAYVSDHPGSFIIPPLVFTSTLANGWRHYSPEGSCVTLARSAARSNNPSRNHHRSPAFLTTAHFRLASCGSFLLPTHTVFFTGLRSLAFCPLGTLVQ